MDPDEALRVLRELMPLIRTDYRIEAAAMGEPAEPYSEDIAADAFEALDEWLSRGGVPPEAWLTVNGDTAGR
jgi:hypothetical protein